MRSPLSQRASNSQPSMTMAITAKAKALQAEGKDVVSFAAGEPDFRTPAPICAAAKKAIDDGLHGYTPNPGMPALRNAICDWFKIENGVQYESKQVLVSPGAKYNIFLALQAMVDPGDEVIIPAPYWVSYPEMVQLVGGTPVIVETKEENGFDLSAAMIEAKITDRTKLLILNSPSNPSGAVFSEKALREIGALLEKRELYCISDEIYSRLLFGGAKHFSIAAASEYCKEHTVVINGCSKAYAMTGWRIGFSAAPAKITTAMADIQSQSTSNACSIAQAAALAAVTGEQGCVEAMREDFEVRRDLIVGLLNEIEGVSCLTPGGAFYVLPNISKILGKTIAGVSVKTPSDFCQLALDKALVACVPGESFGAPDYIRLSYATSRAQIEKGCARLKDLIEGRI